MQRRHLFVLAMSILLMSVAVPALAKKIDQSKNAGPYRVELVVLPPEPFYTAKQVAAGEGKSGMLIVSGAEPVEPDAPSHPDHHLIVHVFQKKTGEVVTDAKVRLAVQPLNSKGEPTGKVEEVPVVVMRMIGMGTASTHYGNNVSLPSGEYRVNATINDHSTHFVIKE